MASRKNVKDLPLNRYLPNHKHQYVPTSCHEHQYVPTSNLRCHTSVLNAESLGKSDHVTRIEGHQDFKSGGHSPIPSFSLLLRILQAASGRFKPSTKTINIVTNAGGPSSRLTSQGQTAPHLSAHSSECHALVQ
ncbi:hypothetical protein BC937DRAFT_92288 [Endogone sp. FLAS-F59071]|nr:hypothetical protein BC937DRAFT_92288 [Endogone sp. FLAS-F59071]|eukprot:RUS21553.1 hypothetical protein BC937DRAFT_92288 [Endogone sp. FLAS-F59071]